MTTHIAPVLAPDACARLSLLRDLADAADIILRDQQEIRTLEEEIASRTARLEELRASVEEGLSLYRDATGQLGSDPAGILGRANGAAPAPPGPTNTATSPGGGTTEKILQVLGASDDALDAREIAARSGLPLTRVRPVLTHLKGSRQIVHAGSRAVDHTRRRSSLYRLATVEPDAE